MIRLITKTTCLLCCTLATGCAGDELGDRPEPNPEGDNDRELGDLIPINVGDTFSYFFSTTFRPTTTSCAGGLICGEKQRAGHFCIKVTQVRDTQTEAYKDAAQTQIVAQVKFVGDAPGTDIVLIDQEQDPADPTTVDDALVSSWLKHLVGPSRGHGFLSPASKTFHTRLAPTPPSQDLSMLPFFDVREPAESTDYTWGGWDWTNSACNDPIFTEQTCPAECKWDPSGHVCANDTMNFLNKLLGYFINTYGASFFMDSALFRKEHPYNPSCGQYSDIGTCQGAQCTWDFMNNVCLVLYPVDIRWRESATSGPVELQNEVLHRIRLSFDETGFLRDASETIAPDPDPLNPTSFHLSTFTACPSGPCLTADLQLDDVTWSQAHCTF